MAIQPSSCETIQSSLPSISQLFEIARQNLRCCNDDLPCYIVDNLFDNNFRDDLLLHVDRNNDDIIEYLPPTGRIFSIVYHDREIHAIHVQAKFNIETTI